MMKNVRDWAFSQLIMNTWAVSRSIAGNGYSLSEEPSSEESSIPGDSDRSPNVNMIASELPCDVSTSPDSSPELLHSTHIEDISSPRPRLSRIKKFDTLEKIEALRIKFLRLLSRLGKCPDDVLVAKVLYRLHLATLIRTEESDLKRINLTNDESKTIASFPNTNGQPELDFSLKILVLGKTGVGKSGTINSILDKSKTVTNAFCPATDEIEEIVGSVSGFTVKLIDTPGLLPSSAGNMRRNRKILHAIKRYIRRSPPDVILYCDRLDLINMDHNDLSLFKLMTEVFGTSFWFNIILVLTHAASAPPEGPTGSPVSYDSYVDRQKDMLQHCIHQAVVDTKLENPYVLVENHPDCRTNALGEKVLPNGQIWKSNLLLYCICTKVLGDANAILKLHNSIELGPSASARHPSLPHLLSSFLRQRNTRGPDGEDDLDEQLFIDEDEEGDEYDKLPPIKILTKSQFRKLSKFQKREYLDELDYREMLFLKKQLKEEWNRRNSKNNLAGEKSLANNENIDATQEPELPPEDAYPLPDMAIPLSFESDCPHYRYRCLVTSEQLYWRPVLDPHGWDRDVGFDGVNLENSIKLNENTLVSVSGQMSKDKRDFSIQSECNASYKDLRNPISCSTGFDVQSGGPDLIYSFHGDAKLRCDAKQRNVVGCGLSLTSFENKRFVGAKVEDALMIGRRVQFVVNAGRVEGAGEAAYGGSIEATVRGRDYPVRKEKVKMMLTALRFNKETVYSGSVDSEFCPRRGVLVSLGANLNSQKMGRIRVRMSSSEHLEIGWLAIFSVFRSLARELK